MSGSTHFLITESEVLFEDNHLIAVFKPAGVLAQEDSTDRSDLLSLTKAYLKEKYNKPGNVFLGLLHRLDKPVSGVVLFAKTSKAASRLSEQIRNRKVRKIYWAIVEGKLADSAATLKDRLTRLEDKTLIQPDGEQEAILSYRTLKKNKDATLVEIDLITGRKHQIRAQFGGRGHPVLGDGKYGAKISQEDIALLAYSLEFRHPVSELLVKVCVPESLYSLESRFAWN